MKKITILCAVLAIATLGITSCNKEEGPMTFRASFDESPAKVQYDLNNGLHFNPENIYIYSFARHNNNNNSCVMYDCEPDANNGKLATFTYADQYPNTPPALTANEGPFVALSGFMGCRLDEFQGNSDGSMSIGGPGYITIDGYGYTDSPMVAKSDTRDFKFKHLMGALLVKYNKSFPILCKRNITLPQGQSFDFLSAKLSWDASGIPQLTDIVKGSQTKEFWHGHCVMQDNNYDWFLIPVLPGVYSGLSFSVSGFDQSSNRASYEKTMAPGATITVERGGITTITVDFTENDRVGSPS